MKTIIISAFPACGKSYLFENQSEYGISCLDSDSSEFSWVKNNKGENTKTRNPNFPNNYIEHIKDNIGKVDFIFVSSHNQVVAALNQNNIKYVKVQPSKKCKLEWIGRFWERGNDDSFIKFISSNWDKFTNDKGDDLRGSMVGKVILTNGEYLSDHIDYILNDF